MIKEQKQIVMRDGIKINCQIHEGGQSVWIIGVHGMGDHMGRHDYLMELFSSDFNVFQYDLRGHGEVREKGDLFKIFLSLRRIC